MPLRDAAAMGQKFRVRLQQRAPEEDWASCDGVLSRSSPASSSAAFTSAGGPMRRTSDSSGAK